MKFDEVKSLLDLKVGSAYRVLSAPMRQATASMRVLPGLIIIGASKSGTSTLFYLLAQHPNLFPSIRKEVHYFDRNYEKGEMWYRSNFAPQFMVERSGVEGIAFEGSPYYMFHPPTPKRMRMLLPDAKIIMMLRNPVDRAYSHYQHTRRNNREPLPFPEAVKAEAERLAPEIEKLRQDEYYQSMSHVNHSYLARSVYIDQIRYWHGFYPRENTLILGSEACFSDPEATYKQVLRFLNLPEVPYKPTKPYNLGGYQSKIDPATYQELRDYFEPYNRELYAYLNQDFGW